MAKNKKADERSSAHQPKRRPRKGSASRKVAEGTCPVKRIWLVQSPVLGWRAFIEEGEASKAAWLAGVEAFPFVPEVPHA